MASLLKLSIIVAACFGVYVFFGANVAATHRYAFGFGGVGFTYLALGTVAAGLLTAKLVK